MLRIAYVRVIQASLAIHHEKLEDPSLGGDEQWLDGILEILDKAKRRIEALATVERIALVNEEDD